MIDREKSVAYSKAGSALETVSGIVLFFGVVATIIIIATSFRDVGYHTEFDWTGLASAIEVLFGSIFIYVFGNAVAKIANYAEAIYKQQNPDYKYDRPIAAGARFMPGDKAIYNKGKDDEATVTIKDVMFDGYTHFICTMPNGEVKEVRNWDLFDIDAE